MIPGIQARQQRRMLIKSWPPQPAFMKTGMGGNKMASSNWRSRGVQAYGILLSASGVDHRLTQDVKKHVSGR